MLLSSLSPLFVLWATRGTTLIPDVWFVSSCAILSVCPSIVLYRESHGPVAIARSANYPWGVTTTVGNTSLSICLPHYFPSIELVS